jgi:predicted Zn-dependent protease
MKQLLGILSLALLVAPGMAHADEPQAGAGPLVRAMRDELTRSVEQLRLPDTAAPYYLAYRVNDQTNVGVSAEFGAVVHRESTHHRTLHVDARVGGYDLDSSNFFSMSPGSFGRDMEGLPLDDDYDAIRHDLWSATDRAYKDAAATYARKQASLKTQAESSDHAGDFSREPASHIVVRRASSPLDLDRAAALAKGLSMLARTYPQLQGSQVTVGGMSGRQIFVSSEGTMTDEDGAVVILTATLRTQAPDGMPLSRFVSFSAASLDALPTREVIEREIGQAAADLSQQRGAPEAEDYLGPVLFEPRAAAQLISTLLAPQVGGAPAPKTDSSNAMFRSMSGAETELAGKVGERVMPAGLRVEDDPTLDRFAGLPLVGGYAADDEGMAGQKVVVVENGILKRFLMSRAPRKGFEHTNGHAHVPRYGPPKAGISNLIVSAKKGTSGPDLRKALLAEAKAAGRPYGVIVRQLDDAAMTGDVTGMLRASRGGSNVPPPLSIVRLMPDGKEQPIRGATFATLPLRTLEDIVAVGAEPAVVSGYSGPLGSVSSVAAPALLIKRVDLKKPTGTQRKPPTLAHPFFVGRQPG